MSRVFTRVAGWAVKHRSKLPQWAVGIMESAARNPDGLVGQLSARLMGGTRNPSNTDVPDAPTRVYIAPTNYAGQGYLWARSLENTDASIVARSMSVELPGGFSFQADTPVSIATVTSSESWARREWEAAQSFSHVLVEAERSMFGKQFDRNLEAEICALQQAGVSVAMICHGTDVRDPDHHAELTPWSLYPEDPRTDMLRIDARKNLKLLARVQLPTFVATPDLLTDVPNAFWCPIVADIDRFKTDRPAFSSRTALAVHSASDPLAKGSHYIEPAIATLVATQELEYQGITATPWAKMPGVIEEADIVIDQFRAGSYGVAACEAMAAGRVVIGHVLPQVRKYIEAETGLQLPILEATPDTLHDVVADLLANREAAQEIAAAGTHYVATVHSGTMSARSLIKNWIQQNDR